MEQILKQNFKKYVDEAESYVISKLNSQVIGKNLWEEKDIIEYGSRLAPDAPIIYLNKKTNQIISNLPNPKILVLGDGVGRLSRYLAEKIPKAKITAVDKSPLMVSQSLKLANDAGLTNYEVLNMDATKLLFKNAAFDFGISFGMVRYLSFQQTIDVIKELLRVTTIGLSLSDSRNPHGYNYYYPYTFQELSSKLLEIGIENNVIHKKMKMYRMSIFYQLYSRYHSDTVFNREINNIAKDKQDVVNLLSNIAGSAVRDFYELEIIK
jgi:ubiquinone/menaquinone biosynthesis C-methylase UbiE